MNSPSDDDLVKFPIDDHGNRSFDSLERRERERYAGDDSRVSTQLAMWERRPETEFLYFCIAIKVTSSSYDGYLALVEGYKRIEVVYTAFWIISVLNRIPLNLLPLIVQICFQM